MASISRPRIRSDKFCVVLCICIGIYSNKITIKNSYYYRLNIKYYAGCNRYIFIETTIEKHFREIKHMNNKKY